MAAWRRAVLGFARRGLRDLPWRATRDPWHVLVSEVMLQQTQAARVIAPWSRFVERFPDPAACAAATGAEVVRRWDGLGYNRRAVNLHRAAAAVVEHHDGRVPRTVVELRKLPGVGPYTARAVVAFAFEGDVAVVDTNVARVVTRAVAGRPMRPGQVQALADVLVPPGRGWLWNQALLDLGAVLCTARAPDCGGCPLRRRCRWATGAAAPDPWRPTSFQSRFEGSDRQGRGRLVAALRRGPVAAGALAASAGWPEDGDRARRAADALVADGLACWNPTGVLTLR